MVIAIDANALYEEVKKNPFTMSMFLTVEQCEGANDAKESILRIIKDAPIISCETCAVPHNKYTGCPKLGGLVTPPDFFCAAYERRGCGCG